MTSSSSSLGIAALLLAGLGGCGSKEDGPPPPEPVVPPAIDAALQAPPQPAPTGVTELPGYDPATGMHLDGKEREAPAAPARPRNRNARMIGIMLRSSPPGALAAVDGQPIGPTPTYWEGEFTGGEREFTFALAKHAVARYRFTPTTNGVVHGRLEPIAVRPGAGTPAIPMPAHPSAPVGAAPVSGNGAVDSSRAPSSTPAAPSAPVTSPNAAEGELGNPYRDAASAGDAAPSAPTAPATPTPAPAPSTPPAGTPPAGTPPSSAPAPAAPAAPAAPSGELSPSPFR